MSLRILVTGNLGYVGPAVLRQLRADHPNAWIHGYDSAFFAHCLTGAALGYRSPIHYEQEMLPDP